MDKFGFDNLPLGCIVGKANLVDVKKYENDEEHNKDKNLHFASPLWGNYGFILKNPTRINLISAKGNLGFWNFN